MDAGKLEGRCSLWAQLASVGLRAQCRNLQQLAQLGDKRSRLWLVSIVPDSKSNRSCCKEHRVASDQVLRYMSLNYTRLVSCRRGVTTTLMLQHCEDNVRYLVLLVLVL